MTSGLSLRVPSLVEWLCTLKEDTGTIFTLRTKTAMFLCSTSIWGQVGELLEVSPFNPFIYLSVKQGSILVKMWLQWLYVDEMNWKDFGSGFKWYSPKMKFRNFVEFWLWEFCSWNAWSRCNMLRQDRSTLIFPIFGQDVRGLLFQYWMTKIFQIASNAEKRNYIYNAILQYYRKPWKLIQTVFHSKLKFKNPYSQKLQAKGKII